MNNIPTAEEFRKTLLKEVGKISVHDFEILFAKRFAELHVEAALKAAAEKIRPEILVQGADEKTIKKGLLNAYPKQLIQ